MATATVNVHLNFRTGPGMNFPRTRVLPPGMCVTIVSRQGEWLRIRTPDGQEGYVFDDYVTEGNCGGATTNLRVTPDVRGLNVRSAPVIANNIIAVVTEGTLLIPLESDSQTLAKLGSTPSQNLWLNVRIPDGRSGYVAAWLLRRADDETTPEPSPSPVEGFNDLYSYINTFSSRHSLPSTYASFRNRATKLGLPVAFDVLPVRPSELRVRTLYVQGFGPILFALNNWRSYYSRVSGMHSGVDYLVPTGTPLIALCDGVIVGTQANWPFLGNTSEKTLTLWCFLPPSIRDSQGRRMLSNVLVAYGHLSDNTMVRRHTVVSAGQQIGKTGYPVGEPGNAHLHLEIHLLSGDNNLPFPRNRGARLLYEYNRPQPFDNNTPFNPLLFYSERLAKYHLHQGATITQTPYPSRAQLANAGLGAWPALDFFSVGSFQYTRTAIWTIKNYPWGNGIFDMSTLLSRINSYTTFEPYPASFI